ncbi:MAG: hypothetical protein PHC91_10665 [Eubacteriales bacterium]|nr:hypothetical protein [Eubacteriales bacterium]
MNEMLAAAQKKSHIMDTAVRQYGKVSLKEYVKQFRPYQGKPLQPPDDFLLFSREYIETLLGKEIALESEKVLRFPLLNTANHHGVDYFPPSVQGNLLFWKALKENGIETNYLPVCSFGIVSLSNSSYARGITSYSSCDHPFRVPIFPKAMENKMVRNVPAFTEEQVLHTISRLDTEFQKTTATKEIRQVLETHYLNKKVLEQNRYGDQAVLINTMLSGEMYPEGDLPQMIYMEMEPIINRLLLKDLKDENTLIYRILYDKRVLGQLKRQIKEGNPFLTTTFFWGTDYAGRRYALDFCDDGRMRGVTLAGKQVELPASAKDIASLIEQGEVVPSGYTMAIVLSFARGYTWLGGYFQGDYLPAWQKGTAAAFAKAEEYRTWAETILRYNCAGYISGPVFVLSRSGNGFLTPAGPLEIIRSGGINSAVLDNLMEATVGDAHRMSLSCSYPELVPPTERSEGWCHKVGAQLLKSYGKQVVFKARSIQE